MKKIIIVLCILCIVVHTGRANQSKDSNNAAALLSKQEKIYALSLLWKELHYNFAYPDRLQKANIDSLYMAFLPKIEQAEGKEYYRTLQAFLAHFNDGHTLISLNPLMDASLEDLPQIRLRIIDGKIILINTAKSMESKIPFGSEIIKINQIPVLKYLKDTISPYVSAPTPYLKLLYSVRMAEMGYSYSFFNITIRTPSNEESDIQLIRNFFATGGEEWALHFSFSSEQPAIEIQIIHDNIGYIQLNTFYPDAVVDTINQVFQQMLPQLHLCKGLIIDIRNNSGGTDLAWWGIAQHLILGDTFTQGVGFSRVHDSFYKAKGQVSDAALMEAVGSTARDSPYIDYYRGLIMEELPYEYPNPVDDSLKLNQPLIILSNHNTASAAEGFLLAMRDAKRGIIMGEPSAAAMGQPLLLLLPGDAIALICAAQMKAIDGTDFSQTGILPDIPVKWDLDAYLHGRDNVLEQAIEEMRKLINE